MGKHRDRFEIFKDKRFKWALQKAKRHKLRQARMINYQCAFADWFNYGVIIWERI